MSMANEAGGPQFELPPQPAEIPERPAEQAQEQAVEQQRPATQEAGVGKRSPQPGGTAITDVQTIPPAPAVQTAPAEKLPIEPLSAATTDLKAGDADLMEKDWMERTKMIEARTRDDPHLQANEMSKIKTDYKQKRFNKIIKTDEATLV